MNHPGKFPADAAAALDLARLRDELQRERQIRERAETGLAQALEERTLLAEQLAQSERQNQTLLSLYAASQREEVGVFELSEDGRRGEPFASGNAPGSQLTAVVPLKAEGRLIGAIAVFRLLEAAGKRRAPQ